MIKLKYPYLFSPIKIGPLTLRNRIAAAPMSFADLSADALFTRDHIEHFKMIARGGVALVTLGEAIVHSATGQSHPKQIALDTDGILPSLVKATDAVHQYGALASIELSHGGMQCDPVFLGGRNPMGPSAGPVTIGFLGKGAKTVVVEEMTEASMNDIAEAYAFSAAMVKLAGFDMCMIHAGHGWLLAQFLSPLTNRRRDGFGGSVENRARFPLMVIDRVRERVGRDFPIELRISGSELAEGGLTLDDVVETCKMVESKVDLIHVSAGTFSAVDTITTMHPSMFLPHGCNVYLAEAVKRAVGIPVTTVGGLSDPKQMEDIIRNGKADIVAMARGLLADPDLPRKAMYGRDEEIVHCLRCFDCQGGMIATQTLKCAVNPVIGRGFESPLPVKTAERKKVIVAGGGPSGMQAAITATENGHEVTLFEKTGALGGALSYSRNVPFKKDLSKFMEYQIRRIASLGIRVRLNTEVTRELFAAEAPDVLIAAIGAEPIIPKIPGIDNKMVIMAAEAHVNDTEIGEKVVIIGGGLLGCETGLFLAQHGKNVTIVEMLGDVALKANILHRRALMLEMGKSVMIRTGLRCTRITDGRLTAGDSEGREIRIEADTVIVAAGFRPSADRLDELRSAALEFTAIGDCAKPGNVLAAVRTGYDAAMAIQDVYQRPLNGPE